MAAALYDVYVTTFLENNFVVFNSNRLTAATLASPSKSSADHKRISSGRYRRERRAEFTGAASLVDEVPQSRLHQLAFGVAFGSITEGTIDGRHGPPFQCSVEALPSHAASGLSSSSPPAAGSSGAVESNPATTSDSRGAAALKYRVTLTSGFAVNTAFCQGSMSTKQCAVALVIGFRQPEALCNVLQFPHLLRCLLHMALDTSISLTTDFFEKHMLGAAPKEAVVELQSSGYAAQAFDGLTDALDALLGIGTERGGPSLPSLSHCLVALPSPMLPRTSLSDFQSAALLLASDSPVAARRLAASPTSSTSLSSPPAAFENITTLLTTALSELAQYNADFLASAISGVLMVSTLRTASGVCVSRSPRTAAVTDNDASLGVVDCWAELQQRQDLTCCGPSTRPPSLAALGSQDELTLPPSAVDDATFHTSSYPAASSKHCDENLNYSALAALSKSEPTHGLQSAAVHVQHQVPHRNRTHRLHHLTTSDLDPAAQRVVIFTTDPELARKLMLVAAFFYRHSSDTATIEHDQYVVESSLEIRKYLEDLRAYHAAVEAQDQRSTSATSRGGRLGSSSSARKASVPDTPVVPPQPPRCFQQAAAVVAAHSRDASLPAPPIAWVCEEYHPKQHNDMLNQRHGVETSVVVIAPRSLIVRRLEFDKEYCSRNLHVERRANGGVQKMFPFGTSSFVSKLLRDDIVVPNQFLKKALQRAMAVPTGKARLAVHPLQYLDEVLDVCAQQCELYALILSQQLGGDVESSVTWRRVEDLMRRSAAGTALQMAHNASSSPPAVRSPALASQDPYLGSRRPNGGSSRPQCESGQVSGRSSVSGGVAPAVAPSARTPQLGPRSAPPQADVLASFGSNRSHPQATRVAPRNDTPPQSNSRSCLITNPEEMLRQLNAELKALYCCEDMDFTHLQLLHVLSTT